MNIYHMKNTDEDWLNATLSTIFQIHQTAPERHDILVFLTGQEEIENMVRNHGSLVPESMDHWYQKEIHGSLIFEFIDNLPSRWDKFGP